MITNGKPKYRGDSALRRREESALLVKYFSEIAAKPVPPKVEQRRLARQMRGFDARRAKRARQQLVEANTRFAVSIAKTYQGNGLDFDDLIGEANAGLMKAVDCFDPDRGFEFITFAVSRIRPAILEALQNRSRLVRLPVNCSEGLRLIQKTKDKLEQKKLRRVTQKELAKKLRMPEQRVDELQNFGRKPTSLDEPLSFDGETTLHDHFMNGQPDQTEQPLHNVDRQKLRQLIKRELRNLPPKVATLLTLYFGLDDGPPMTYKAIASIFGCKRQNLKRYMDLGLAHFKFPKRAEKLKPFHI